MAIDLRDGVDFMDVLQVIKNRRSIHTFQPQEVPDDILIDIFSYASYAPTHYMKEPWNIKMYQGEGRHKLIDESMASYKRLGMFETGSEVKTEKMIASMKDFLLDIPHHALIYMPIEEEDRKSTRLNSSHVAISYAVFCLKKKKKIQKR